MPQLVSELRADFYADPEMMADALKRGRSSNPIHLATSYNVDILPLGPDQYSRQSFRAPPLRPDLGSRRTTRRNALSPAREDIILSKFGWYRAGGEVCDTQSRGLRGIVMVRGAGLDHEYLRASGHHGRELLTCSSGCWASNERPLT